MKVLFINTVYARSSTGRIVCDLCSVLRDQGDQCEVIYGRYPVPEQAGIHAVGSRAEQALHGVKSRLLDRTGFGSAHATRRMVEIIRQAKPDLIHLHNLHGYYLNIDILFTYLAVAGIPVVWTIHDCWPFTGHCVYYDYAGCNRWRQGCGSCPNLRAYPSSIGLDSSEKNYRDKRRLFTGVKNMTLVAVSDWLKGQIEASFLGGYEVKRIYNGVDRRIFRPVESQIRSKLGIGERFLILGVSDAWSERKGFRFFTQLAQRLREDEVIVMVGFRRQEEIDRLPRGIIGLMRTDSVEQLVELYTAADVVLNPSYEETFGLVTAEALCCGTPVIVQNATASPELVDESCGRVIAKGSFEGLYKALQELREQRIGADSCLRRSELFDRDRNYRQYLELYHSMEKGVKACGTN